VLQSHFPCLPLSDQQAYKSDLLLLFSEQYNFTNIFVSPYLYHMKIVNKKDVKQLFKIDNLFAEIEKCMIIRQTGQVYS